MKKRVLFLLLICFCLSSFACSNDSGSSIRYNKSGKPTTEELSQMIGYDFCGYYKDENLTQKVDTPNESEIESYYPKYQPNKAEMLSAEKMALQETVYATDFRDAINKYKIFSNYSKIIGSQTIYNNNFGNFFSNTDLTQIDIAFGEKAKGLNKFLYLIDKSPYVYNVQENGGVTKFTIDREIKWNTYIGDVREKDGFKYYIVQHKYAVIVGLNSENEIKGELVIPSEIDKKPVQEISMYLDVEYKFDISKLTVPSTVNNVLIADYSCNSNNKIDEIVFENGVKTVRLIQGKYGKISIPASVYYLDINPCKDIGLSFGMYTDNDQAITIDENNVHYYTYDGCIYSTEGDLVYQFANKKKLDLRIKDGTKRILRASVTGKNKNIYLPDSVEYIDPLFNEFSPRFDTLKNGNATAITNYLFFTNNKRFLINWFACQDGCFYDCFGHNYVDYYGILPIYLRYNFITTLSSEQFLGVFDEYLDMVVEKGFTTQNFVDEHKQERQEILKELFKEKPEIKDGIMYIYDTDIYGNRSEELSVYTYITDEYQGEITEQMLDELDSVFSKFSN